MCTKPNHTNLLVYKIVLPTYLELTYKNLNVAGLEPAPPGPRPSPDQSWLVSRVTLKHVKNRITYRIILQLKLFYN